MTAKIKYKRTTDLQADLVIRMMKQAGYLMHRKGHTGRDGMMLYSGLMEPVRWYSDNTVKILHDVLKKDKLHRFTISLKLVRSMDGRTFIKKQYKKSRRIKVTYV